MRGGSEYKVFQSRASHRKRKNIVRGLRRGDDSLCTADEEMRNLAASFYAALFTSEGSTHGERILKHIEPVVTEEMNNRLGALVTGEEIEKALFQMGPTKAPGPDGLSALFYQRHWSLLKEDICRAVRGFLAGEEMPADFNETIIVMIPKINSPELLSQFRPISLCNVLYKIASKVLANRLKVFLPLMISKDQSAFVPGRLITDNVLVAYECVHAIRTRKRKKPMCAVKLDMMKASDRVEWIFLEHMLERYGFSQGWITMIMRCVTTATFSVKLHGGLSSLFSPSRGLRQGDPLSPYLFLFCVEGFSALLKSAQNEGSLSGVKFGSTGPTVTHLLFVDDSVVFLEGSQQNLETLKHILEDYEVASRQRVNLQKSSIFFGKGCKEEEKSGLKNVIGIESEALSERYLGLPTVVGKSKEGTFKHVREASSSKVSGWKGQGLSKAAREVLVKFILQATPTYTMSCFQLTKKLCGNLSSISSKFWWGASTGERKVHWIAWDKMYERKANGGMGFRDPEAFNQALLAKQAWRLLRVLSARYYSYGNIMNATCPNGASFTYRSIIHGRNLLSEGTIWRIGNGTQIKVHHDNWISRAGCLKPLGEIHLPGVLHVADLLDSSRAVWDRDKVESMFCEDESKEILQIPIGGQGHEDVLAWNYTRNGVFTVRSAYHLRMQLNKDRAGQPEMSTVKNRRGWLALWDSDAPGKAIIHCWRLIRNGLAVGAELKRRSIKQGVVCTACGREGGNNVQA